VVDGEPAVRDLSPFERWLLAGFQRDLPLAPRPFAEIARRLGADEATVLDALRRLQKAGVISRVGAVFAPHGAGWSTLAAMAVPAYRLEEVAALVSACPEVNHNYEREHRINLWFVVAAPTEARVGEVLRGIEAATGLPVLDLPLVESYRLDLGFPLTWA
jgi:siroheme decarboxylase